MYKISKQISIHALLAESDMPVSISGTPQFNFYPRSPCGERRTERLAGTWTIYFYPRSPCGERPAPVALRLTLGGFLSTLSLRRATAIDLYTGNAVLISIHALLAESDKNTLSNVINRSISIHALLAESDHPIGVLVRVVKISIHALLAESDPENPMIGVNKIPFLSTLSLRRATRAL